MPEEIGYGERKARKAHQCFNCYRAIPKGAMHYFFTGKDDGRIYTIRSHPDCRAASLDYISEGYPPDYDDGIPPLADMIGDSGDFQIECDRMRGHWPHVIARLELNEQLAEIKYQARLAEWEAARLSRAED